jgi:hypothetical protein
MFVFCYCLSFLKIQCVSLSIAVFQYDDDFAVLFPSIACFSILRKITCDRSVFSPVSSTNKTNSRECRYN